MGPTKEAPVIVDRLPEHLREDAVSLWQEAGLTRPWNDPRADLDRALEGPSSTVLAALGEDGLVGTAMVGHDGHRGWVYYVAVRPAHRGQGLGRALMAACEQWVAGCGIPKMQLMVRTGNAGTRAFYERLGYAVQDTVVLGRFFDAERQAQQSG
ncbi:GNAT family acetyltransferase [Kocuria sabuli]|uniref:GNAT family acetyltransferase n=1 Tax=Kocuria sabuli TaxID=3071448 RepID=UPI0034D72251